MRHLALVQVSTPNSHFTRTIFTDSCCEVTATDVALVYIPLSYEEYYMSKPTMFCFLQEIPKPQSLTFGKGMLICSIAISPLRQK